MRNTNFVSQLTNELEKLPVKYLEKWNRYGGLELSGLINLITSPVDNSIVFPNDTRHDVIEKPTDDPQVLELGVKSLMRDETALCILHDGSNPEGLKKILDESYPVRTPWIITRAGDLTSTLSIVKEKNVKVFTLFELPSLTVGYDLVIRDGSPVEYPGGCGDIYGVLSEGGFLDQFVLNGGKYIILTESRNPVKKMSSILSSHISSNNVITACVEERKNSYPLLCEYNGTNILVQKCRIATEENLSYSGTGTYVLPAQLTNDEIPWIWNRVRKIEDTVTVEYRRYISQLTEILPTRYVKIS